jgi:hypothetical protein
MITWAIAAAQASADRAMASPSRCRSEMADSSGGRGDRAAGELVDT